jgi:hypothetical protein
MNKTSTQKKTRFQLSSKNSSTSILKQTEPSENSIRAILSFSQALSVRKSKNIDFIEFLLN